MMPCLIPRWCRRILILSVLAFMGFLLARAWNRLERPELDGGASASLCWVAMGTSAGLTLPGFQAERLQGLKQSVQEVYARIEGELSPYKPGNWLRLAHAEKPIPIPAELYPLVAESIRLARQSQGAFSPAIEPLMRLWGFRGAPPEVPPSEAETLALARAVRADLSLSLEGDRLLVSKPARDAVQTTGSGLLLDFGAIAKGYAVDLAAKRIPPDVPDILIDLGGTLYAKGHCPARTDGWRVAVRNPYQPKGAIGWFVLPPEMATSTSGGYERFVSIGSNHVGHLLDPRTGRPVKPCAAVTVIAPTATLADALSTTLYILGPGQGRDWLQQHHPEAHAVWYPSDPREPPATTPGFPTINPFPTRPR